MIWLLPSFTRDVWSVPWLVEGPLILATRSDLLMYLSLLLIPIKPNSGMLMYNTKIVCKGLSLSPATRILELDKDSFLVRLERP